MITEPARFAYCPRAYAGLPAESSAYPLINISSSFIAPRATSPPMRWETAGLTQPVRCYQRRRRTSVSLAGRGRCNALHFRSGGHDLVLSTGAPYSTLPNGTGAACMPDNPQRWQPTAVDRPQAM